MRGRRSASTAISKAPRSIGSAASTSPTCRTVVTEYDGEPNGLKIHKDGRIFIADYRHGVMVLDPTSGAVAPFADLLPAESFKGLNDLVFASNGDLYFTDQGKTGLQDPTGRVYHFAADGRLMPRSAK